MPTGDWMTVPANTTSTDYVYTGTTGGIDTSTLNLTGSNFKLDPVLGQIPVPPFNAPPVADPDEQGPVAKDLATRIKEILRDE